MGGIALLALGGLVALAASAASSSRERRRPAAPPPPGAGYPPPPDPGSVPASQAPAPQVPAPQAPAPAAPSPSSAPTSPAPQPASPAAPSAPIAPGAPSAANTAELVQWLQAWLASDPPPAQVELVASRLEEAGMAETASQLRAFAQRSREQGGGGAPTGPVLVPDPTSPAPSSRSPEPAAPAPSTPPAAAPRPAAPTSPPATASAAAPPSGGSAAPSSAGSLAADTAVALQQRWTEIQSRIRAFQQVAGIAVDGLYGPTTRAALAFWTGRAAPRPWRGSGIGRYEPENAERGDGTELSNRAERLARSLYSALIAPEGPARSAVEQFQRANGLTVDGKYGEQTRAALERLGVANPPPAFRRTRSRRRGRGS